MLKVSVFICSSAERSLRLGEHEFYWSPSLKKSKGSSSMAIGISMQDYLGTSLSSLIQMSLETSRLSIIIVKQSPLFMLLLRFVNMLSCLRTACSIKSIRFPQFPPTLLICLLFERLCDSEEWVEYLCMFVFCRDFECK